MAFRSRTPRHTDGANTSDDRPRTAHAMKPAAAPSTAGVVIAALMRVDAAPAKAGCDLKLLTALRVANRSGRTTRHPESTDNARAPFRRRRCPAPGREAQSDRRDRFRTAL